MKKSLFFAAAAAALAFSACTNEEEVMNVAENNGEVAVTFADPYLTTTRAEVVNLNKLKGQGFGVYAYEQGSASYKTYSSNSSYPNFFYNQKIEWDGTSEWMYSPLKYFSNNEGAKHSFFAYGPYKADVKTVFAIGNAPAIRYAASDDYDLLYAEAHKDMEKPDVSEKITFKFKHALSQVNFYVAPFVDKVHADHSEGVVLDDNTKIIVRSVKFVGTVASQGLMSLEDGSWTFEATEESAYELNDPVTLTKDHMTAAGQYAPVKENMMVIPTQTGKKVKIQVIYDVITVDPDHSENSSIITNKVVSSTDYDLVRGNAYNFMLDLGMTSVKFDAQVKAWGTATENNVDLPNNQ